VPLQIARAENESFVILKDGLREDVSDFSSLSELADFISFGLYELVLESNENPVVVISSMGKQSTGKSYMLNHLAGQTDRSRNQRSHKKRICHSPQNQHCFLQPLFLSGTTFDTAGGRCVELSWIRRSESWAFTVLNDPCARWLASLRY